jgi:prepilin-type N-terminal cleavage/methylation domain-containing protein
MLAVSGLKHGLGFTPGRLNRWSTMSDRLRELICCARRATRQRAFTLIELMIVIVLLGALAAIVVPLFSVVGDSPRVEVLAANTRAIQIMIARESTGGGFPPAIDAGWFSSGGLPQHTLANRAMNVEVVSDAMTVIYPLVKTFDPAVPGDPNAWYNTTNGAFRARVPPQGSDAETIQIFNDSNKTGITALDQTTD